MPRRTLALKRIRRHKNGDQKDNPLDEFGGHDLLHLFRAWATSDMASQTALSDESRRLHLRIESVAEGGRWVLIEAEFGFWGESGSTRDVDTDQVVHQRAKNHAPMQHSRLMFFVPPESTSGFFLVEKVGAYGAGARIIDAFKVSLTGAFSKESWLVETVTESTAWNAGAQLLSVRAIAHGFPVDIGDSEIATHGRIEQVLVPDKGMGRYLPHVLFRKLREKEVAAGQFMALPDEVEIEETYLEVERDGQTKTYSVDKETVPAIRVALNDANEDALGLNDFRIKCLDEVADLRALEGEPWEESWRDGTWSDASLRLTFPKPGT